MSAPDTNIEKQARRHKGPLVGIIGAVIVAGLLFIAFLTWVADEPDEAVPAADVAIELE